VRTAEKKKTTQKDPEKQYNPWMEGSCEPHGWAKEKINDPQLQADSIKKKKKKKKEKN
jgi:hypothetical protein